MEPTLETNVSVIRISYTEADCCSFPHTNAVMLVQAIHMECGKGL